MASNCQITGCKETTKTKNEVTEVNNTDLPNNNNNNVTKNKNGSNNNTKNTNSNNNSSKNNSNEKFKNDSSAVRNKSPKKNAKQSNFNNKPRINESNTVISSSKVETSSSVTTTTTSAASTVPAESECTENYILTYGPVSSITNGDVYNVISNDLTDVAYQSYTYETVDQSVTSGPSQTYYCYEDVSSIGTDTSAADTLYSNTINPSETLYSNEINPSNNLYSSAVVNNPENLYSTTVDPSQTLYSTTVNPSISIHSVNVQPSETLYSTTLSSSGTTVYATEISPSITLHDTNGNTPEALYSTVSPSGTTVYSADMNPTIALHTIDVGPSEALYGTTGTTVYATEMSPSVTLHESNGNPSETLYTTTISPSGTTVYATEICPSITLHESNVSSPEALYSSTVDASGNTVYTTDISPSITLHNSNISPPETLYTATLSPSETTVYTANHHETLYANAINPQETLYSNNINSSEQLYSNNVDSSDDLYSNDVNSSENLYNNDNTVFYKNTSKESEVFNKAKSSNFAETQQRHAYLNYEQVCRLNDVMNEVVCIHGRGNFPTLEVKLRDLVTVVRDKLRTEIKSGGEGMKVHDIRLNGGAASHVLATESQPYNDLDLIFGVELSNGRNYDKVKAAVLGSLFDLLPEGVSRKRITTCSLKEAYVSKMVKVSNDGDRWSLISLGNSRGHRNVELKFVDTMRRQFEFSVDSFQIVLDSLLMFYERSKVQMNESFYPTIIGESVYGDFQEAIYHLQKKLISTRHPEEIRGGGLLKYCNLLVKNYKPAQPNYIKTLERYMCSRFFIDFPDITQQRAKLENYLWNHFVGVDEEALKYQYLMLLHSVVEESTVCLMGHERRQTLALIENLAYQVFCQEQQKRLTNHQPPPGPPTYVYANGYYYTPVIPACYACSCNTTWMACSS